MYRVYFPDLEQSMDLPEQSTVAQACSRAGYPLNLVCGGNGSCGKCLTWIEDPQGRRQVLACQTPISDGMRIYPEQEDQLKILEAGWGRVSVQATGDQSQQYVAACDLGTTSVVLYLFDSHKGVLVGQWSESNHQSVLGGDVIARMQAAMTEEGKQQLQHKALETIGYLLSRAATQSGISTRDISRLTIAGNSVMQHLLFGFPVEQLAASPYECYTEAAVTRFGSELELGMAPDAVIKFLPLIGSFVGGDTTAAMLAADWEDEQAVRLLIDLGTNGELVIGNRSRSLAASAAAGPAMEGAGIVHGMRGTEGAIERVFWDGTQLRLQVIGGGKPAGLCGSGLVDLTAVLLECGVLQSNGRILSREELLAQGGAPELAARLVTAEDGERCFVVAGSEESADGNALLFYQQDVRALQLSKGAIAAAAVMLQQAFDPDENRITQILLAGAFGNYIDIHSAQRIGLIPDYPGIEVLPVGNAAGTGAQMYLLSPEKEKAANAMAASTVHMNLASNPDFAYLFGACMELCPVSEMELEDFL